MNKDIVLSDYWGLNCDGGNRLHVCLLSSYCAGPGPEYADVVFLVDSSDYLGIKSFPFVRTFLNRMIDQMEHTLEVKGNEWMILEESQMIWKMMVLIVLI